MVSSGASDAVSCPLTSLSDADFLLFKVLPLGVFQAAAFDPTYTSSLRCLAQDPHLGCPQLLADRLKKLFERQMTKDLIRHLNYLTPCRRAAPRAPTEVQGHSKNPTGDEGAVPARARVALSACDDGDVTISHRSGWFSRRQVIGTFKSRDGAVYTVTGAPGGVRVTVEADQ
jgi:hypothetical protein